MNNYTVNPNVNAHAYHLDATKLGSLCKDKSAIPNGVKHIIDDILEVVVDQNGVKEILGKKDVYQADLYIDCTGFKSVLRKELGVNYLQHNMLINNCAIAGPGKYLTDEKPLPYTQTFTMNKGWRWRVCLQHRTGNGYVFNKNYISIEDAKQELIEKTPGIEKDKIFVVPFENGFNPEPWKQNVISIGLSCGFLEPLEATGLFLVTSPTVLLEKLIGDKKGPEKFNKLWTKIYNETSYFIGMFYANGPYNNDYWNNFRKENILNVPKVKWTFPDYSYRMLARAKSFNLQYAD
jgi:tryptophan halogenase